MLANKPANDPRWHIPNDERYMIVIEFLKQVIKLFSKQRWCMMIPLTEVSLQGLEVLPLY